MELITFLDWNNFTSDIYNQLTNKGFGTVTTYNLYRFKNCTGEYHSSSTPPCEYYTWKKDSYFFVAKLYGDREKDEIAVYKDEIVIQKYITFPDRSKVRNQLKSIFFDEYNYNYVFNENIYAANLYIERVKKRSGN